MAVRRDPIGWPLLPLPDASGSLRYPASLDDSVQCSIKVILATRPGELLGHADFGVGLDLYRGQLGSLTLRRQIRDGIMEQLARHEPRIDVDRVEVEPSLEAPEVLRVAIVYRLKRSGAPGRVGLSLDMRA